MLPNDKSARKVNARDGCRFPPLRSCRIVDFFRVWANILCEIGCGVGSEQGFL